MIWFCGILLSLETPRKQAYKKTDSISVMDEISEGEALSNGFISVLSRVGRLVPGIAISDSADIIEITSCYFESFPSLP